MSFSKTFPKTIPGSNFPIWEEIVLTEEEEQQVEEQCRRENFRILDQCLDDARAMAIEHRLNTEENQIALGIALFEKRASHSIHYKENRAKQKFDMLHKN